MTFAPKAHQPVPAWPVGLDGEEFGGNLGRGMGSYCRHALLPLLAAGRTLLDWASQGPVPSGPSLSLWHGPGLSWALGTPRALTGQTSLQDPGFLGKTSAGGIALPAPVSRSLDSLILTVSLMILCPALSSPLLLFTCPYLSFSTVFLLFLSL